MGLRVDLTPQAEADLEEIFDWVAARAPYRAPIWFSRLEGAILSLGQRPERCPIVPVLSTGRHPVRQLLFGRRRHVYRVYFSVVDDVVKVLHVRHGARRRPRRLERNQAG